jgi:hypothetical protein
METLKKILSSYVFWFVIALVCSLLYSRAELNLGTEIANLFAFSVAFGAIFGGFIELVRSRLVYREKFIIYNPISWVLGAVIGTALMIFL